MAFKIFYHPRVYLTLLLLTAFLLRFALILHGGTHYWPDEKRYRGARLAVNALAEGNYREALETLHGADHFLFKIVGLIPATIEQMTVTGPLIPPLFFSLFSVLNIGLLWAIARRLGAGEGEATTAAFLFALSTSYFYFCRHLVPYDVSTTFGLLALWIAVREPVRLREACLCGLLSSCCLLTYNGYWALAGFALVVLVLRGWPRPRTMAQRAVCAGACLLAPFLTLVSLSALLGGDLLAQYLRFSSTVTQGNFGEGAAVPFAYLWYAEHLLLPFWLLVLGTSLAYAWRHGMDRRVAVGAGGALFIYTLLAATSSGLHLFVVYGRLARQVVPFLCLLVGHELYRMRGPSPRRQVAFAAVCLSLTAQAAWNFYPPLTQVFPREFKRHARSIAASYAPQATQLRYAEHIFPVPYETTPPPGKLLLEARHPLQYLPYQYEGYTPKQREALRTADIAMALYAVDTK